LTLFWIIESNSCVGFFIFKFYTIIFKKSTLYADYYAFIAGFCVGIDEKWVFVGHINGQSCRVLRYILTLGTWTYFLAVISGYGISSSKKHNHFNPEE